MSKSNTSQTQETTSAAELVVMIENGDSAAMLASVETLNQRDFIRVQRTIQTVEKALSAYALSWKNCEYWGNGEPFPDEAQAKAA